MKHKLLIFFAAAFLIGMFTPEPVHSQNDNLQESEEKITPQDKPRRLLPGEEVRTPSGKTMKVWTTEGPVPVSKAPEPFEDREKTVIPNMGIFVDAEGRPVDVPERSHQKDDLMR